MEYIIQENTFREQHYNLLYDAMNRLGLKHTTIRQFPFIDKITALDQITTDSYNVDDLPDFEPQDTSNLFVFGSTKLARIVKDKNWSPGSLLNDNHNFLVYSKYYKDNLLNYDSEIHTIGSSFNWKPNEEKFIRPTHDSKAFTGALFTEKVWKDTVETYLHNYKSFQFNEDTTIQVSTPKHIYKEIRFWVVDGKIVTGSQYRLGSQVIYDPIYEQEAVDYAQSMVDIFPLADGFVIDVCLTDNGWKIVECGCINCAGFYKSDLQKMIMALEDKYEY